MNEYHGVFNIICAIVRDHIRNLPVWEYQQRGMLVRMIRQELARLRMLRELGVK